MPHRNEAHERPFMHEWIKLHTTIKDHELMRDGTALHVFIYMLISADDNGYGIVSRYKSAQFLGLNSNTFYSALKRCEKKYKLATLTSTRYWTNFSILNWHKYQTIGNTSNNTSATPEQHLSNTNINKERIRKRIRISKVSVETFFLPFKSIDSTECGAKATQFDVRPKDIVYCAQLCETWHKGKEVEELTAVEWEARLDNWIIKALRRHELATLSDKQEKEQPKAKKLPEDVQFYLEMQKLGRIK